MSISIEDLLSSHGIGSGSGSGGLKVVKTPTEPTEGLRDGLLWINETNDEKKIFLDGAFHDFGIATSLDELTGQVVVPSDTSSVEIPIQNFIPGTDLLVVAQNTTKLTRGYDYTIDTATKRIVKKSGVWKEGTTLNFTAYIKTSGSISGLDVAVFEDHVNVAAGVLIINFNISAFDANTDHLIVHQRNVPIYENVNWTLNSDWSSITLHEATREPEEFHFMVIKKMRSATREVIENDEVQQFMTDTTKHIENDSDKKHIEVVSEFPVDLSKSGVFFKVDGSSPDVPGQTTVGSLQEQIDEQGTKLTEHLDESNTASHTINNISGLQESLPVGISGSYLGDSRGTSREIDLGFRPKVVYIYGKYGTANAFTVITDNISYVDVSGNNNTLNVTTHLGLSDKGFVVNKASSVDNHFNSTGVEHYYTAIK